MLASRRLGASLFVAAVLGACGQARAATTASFTPGTEGTFPGSFKLDRQKGLLTVDLAGIPKDAVVFRAELVLQPIASYMDKPPLTPTRVYPDGRPGEFLKLAAPRFTGLDALEAVRAAVEAGTPLVLKIESTCHGVARLEVSFSGGKPRAGKLPTAAGLKVASHRAGQTLLTFTEPKLENFPEFKTGADVKTFAGEFGKRHPGMGLRVWRSEEKITPESIGKARLVGELGFFSAWNSTYHQGNTDKSPPLRYRVTDLGDELPWGTGVYAHNPDRPGKAFYAVTVAVDGEEDFSTLGDGNTTAAAVDEAVGPGDPVLQWMETPTSWLYRNARKGGTLTRLVYTRWESWPHSSRPNFPIDYLVAIPDTAPAGGGEAAPVGLHLHCWGGSLNGGYGWWYNAHRGAILIASNQIPYDWWTGYHESRFVCKTFGDGFVRPFTMNRLFGFLDWAATQWEKAPEAVRPHWRKLDLTRTFTAGASMGGSGAPMYPIRHGNRVAWCISWVGVHVPEESPTFKGSYAGNYGPRNPAITMPDGKTSPWDYFSDAWWLRNNPRAETGFIMAANGPNDGGIGWPQAVKFARALQETRRPHMYNWAMGGHLTRTLVGADFDLDVRTDQSLPAFTNCTLDDNIGTGTPRPKEEVEAEKKRQTEEKAAGKRTAVLVDEFDGEPKGQYNGYLWWQTDDLVDTPEAWELTVILQKNAPRDSCAVDLTPRRLQKFRTPKGARFAYTVTDLQAGKESAKGEAAADELDLLTLRQIPLTKGRNRVKIVPAR